MRIDGIGNWVLLIMAAASLILIIAAFSLESIVSQDLSRYGLQFSYDWAIPYWNTIGTIFAMEWLKIIAAVAFQIYRIITIRKEEKQSASELENTLKSNDDSENWSINVYELVTKQAATGEAKEQLQTIPYEPAMCKQTEPRDSKQSEE
jgi:hypothetical protein